VNPNEYDWQMGGLADLGLYPDERGFQPTPTPPEKAWPVPTTGMAPWPYQEQPAQTEAELAQQAREAAAYRNRRGYEVASTRPQESNRLTAVAGAIGNLPYAIGSLAAIPGQTMTENPYPPGSEEWQFFEDARKSNTYQKAPELASSLMGTGTAFMQQGALGMAGGRIKSEPLVGFAPGQRGTGRTLASPEEITRAAAESRKGMTQPELRKLYDELGLTGTAPSELVSKSLARSQPAKLVEAATELKLADRAVINSLTPEQRLAYQKGKPLPEGVTLPSQDAVWPALEKYLPIKKEVAKAEKEFDKGGGGIGALFDLSPKTLMQLPDVPQFPLPRVAPKITERLEPAAQGGLARVERAAAAAPEENWGWYNLMQQRDLMHKLHGPEKGEQVFNALLDSIAGTSMLNPIDNNLRSATWYLQQVMQGKPLPEVLHIIDPVTGQTVKTMAGGPPPGYGAKSQIQHADRVREYMSHQYDPVANPKPISYRTNLSGNYAPRTVDTHDIRNIIGMPRALKEFGENSSLLPGEYTHLEDVGARAAKRAGTPQAPQQAATWVGGGEYTGLKSYPAPLATAINRRAHVTAKVHDISPEQALEEAFRGKRPFLGVGAAPVIGELAAQDDYQ